jgi:hypothetical protein
MKKQKQKQDEGRSTLPCTYVTEGQTIQSRLTGKQHNVKLVPQNGGNVTKKLAAALNAKSDGE